MLFNYAFIKVVLKMLDSSFNGSRRVEVLLLLVRDLLWHIVYCVGHNLGPLQVSPLSVYGLDIFSEPSGLL